MRNICFLILILLLSGCQNSSNPKNYEIPIHEKIADKITAKTAAKIEHETRLRLMGTGGGMMHHVRMMAMSFAHYGEIDMEQGRELIVYCVNEYLSAINADAEIHPYLIHSPFTPKDIEIRIFIYQSDNKPVSEEQLSVISEIQGMITYKVEQPFPIVLKEIHEETYEEALAVLEMQGGFRKIHANIHPM